MSQQLSKTQVTEPPRDPNYFQQCINDFYDFKERNLRREINSEV